VKSSYVTSILKNKGAIAMNEVSVVTEDSAAKLTYLTISLFRKGVVSLFKLDTKKFLESFLFQRLQAVLYGLDQIVGKIQKESDGGMIQHEH
jgi:hypothetical protein